MATAPENVQSNTGTNTRDRNNIAGGSSGIQEARTELPSSTGNKDATKDPDLDVEVKAEEFRGAMNLDFRPQRVKGTSTALAFWQRSGTRRGQKSPTSTTGDLENNPQAEDILHPQVEEWGFLETVIRQRRKAVFKCRMVEWTQNLLLGLQAILSAVFVALGASQLQHKTSITVLGVLNGVIAAILSLIKGQGLPTRLKGYVSGLRKVIDRYEDLERNFALKRPVTMRDVQGLMDLYRTVKDDADSNDPDVGQTNVQQPDHKKPTAPSSNGSSIQSH